MALKLNIQKTKIMASGPITSWQIDGETVSDFVLGAPKSLQMLTAVTAAAKSLQSCLTLCNPVKAHQAPQSLGFYRQEYWSGLPLPSPGDGDCSHEIERRLLLGRKVMANLDSLLKSRDITLPTKVHLVKAMVFPVVMYGCDSWIIKKAEC